jgi:hypothetical protein
MSQQNDAIIQQLQIGRKIEAIKLMREQRGLGLKEAKEEVDKLEAQLRREGKLPEKTGSGCALSLLLLLSLCLWAGLKSGIGV